MLITNAAVIRLATASDDAKTKLYNTGINYGAVIKKAKAIMLDAPADVKEKLDEVVAECSLPLAKEKYGDAIILEQYG